MPFFLRDLRGEIDCLGFEFNLNFKDNRACLPPLQFLIGFLDFFEPLFGQHFELITQIFHFVGVILAGKFPVRLFDGFL